MARISMLCRTITIILVMVINAASQDYKVAITRFTVEEVNKMAGNAATDELQLYLNSKYDPGYEITIITRTEIEKVLTELEIYEAECTDDECYLPLFDRLKANFSANVLLTGKIRGFLGSYTIYIKKFEFAPGQNSAEIKGPYKEKFDSLEDLNREEFYQRLCEKIFPPREITYGRLKVSTKSGSQEIMGAAIYIDGILHNLKTPEILPRVATGVRHIQCTKDNLVGEAETEVYEDIFQEVTVNLRVGSGNIALRSTPPIAKIIIDNKDFEKSTPYEISGISAKLHAITLKLYGYCDTTFYVQVYPEKTTKSSVSLVKSGFLSISVNPILSQINLDNHLPLEPPLINYPVNPGRHVIEIRSPGYLDEADTIYINPGQSLKKYYTLEQPCGLIIDTYPSAATVKANGRVLGITPLTSQNLKPGKYTIELGHNLCHPKIVSNTIQSGEIKNLGILPLSRKTGKLSIDSDPKGAEVKINNRIIGTTPITVPSLEYGEIELEIIKDTYTPHKNSFVYTGTNTQGIGNNRYFIKLNRWGLLPLNSRPQNAQVFLDDKYVGRTPLNLSASQGSHNIVIKQDDHNNDSFTVSFSDERTYQQMTRSLTKMTKDITINTTPDNARISIDNKLIGNSNISSHNIEFGRHSIRIMKDNYLELDSTITVNANISGYDFQLTELGEIKINTNPIGMLVSLDKIEKGKTPKVIRSIKPGIHKLTITDQNEFCQDYNTILTILSGKNPDTDINMIPKISKLSIHSDPSGADLYIDGRKAGRTPYSDNISYGKHEINLIKKDYQDYSNAVFVNKSEFLQQAELILKKGEVQFNVIPSDATIHFSGNVLGTNRLSKQLNYGSYSYVIKRKGYSRDAGSLIVNKDKISLHSQLKPLNPLCLQLLLPGMAQHRAGQHTKGWIWNIVGIASAASAFFFTTENDDKLENYNNARDDYYNEFDISLLDQKFKATEKAYQESMDSYNLMIISWGVTGAVWVLNIVDGILFFPPRYNEKSPSISMNQKLKSKIQPVTEYNMIGIRYTIIL